MKKPLLPFIVLFIFQLSVANEFDLDRIVFSNTNEKLENSETKPKEANFNKISDYLIPDTPTLFRYTKVRKWHVELEWAAASNAVSYEIYQDNVLRETVTSTTYSAINLLENKNYAFKVRSKSSTGEYSDFTPIVDVRTGLYPKMEYPQMHEYNYSSEPPLGNTSYTNEFGLTEQRVSQRSVNGDIEANMLYYPKNTHFYTGADGKNKWFQTGRKGTDLRQQYDYDTYVRLPQKNASWMISPKANNDEITYYSLHNELFKVTNSTATKIFTAVGYRDDTRSLIPTAESYPSFDGKYLALEAYKAGNSNTWCIVFDLDTETVISEVELDTNVDQGVVSMSASGRYVIWHSSSNSIVGSRYVVRNNDATQSDTGLGSFTVTKSGHGDLGVTIQGNDCALIRDNGKAYLYVFEGPKAGQSIDLFSGTSRDSEPGHISCKNFDLPGWGFINNGWQFDVGPGEVGLYWFRKVYAVMLDEYASDRGEDTFIRHYTRGMWDGAVTASGSYDNIYPAPSRDGLKVAFNNYFGTVNTSYTFGEMYICQQLTEHGDEIPINNTSAPIVTNITVSDITENSFKASWNLDEGSKGRIEYGTSSTNYTEETNSEENFLTYHIQNVGNNNAPPLQAGTTYYWRIRTEDIEGNVGYSDEQVTTTTGGTPLQTTTFDPIHDAYLQGSTRYNTTVLRVEQGNRISYMKYDLGAVNGTITSAELHFQTNDDAGIGTMQVYKGTSTSWTETNLNNTNKPAENGLLGSTTGIDEEFTDVIVPLSISSLSGGSDLSLIVKHVGGNDFSMASDENTVAPGPKLVVTYQDNVPVTGVTVTPDTLNLFITDTSSLTATISPSNATDQNVSWSSSDTSVVTVDTSGSVIAVSSGSVTVTATTDDGSFTASTNITVLSNAPIVSNIMVSDITETSFKVSWNLDEGSKGRIEYGTSSGNYAEQTNSEENFLTYHIQNVGNNNAPPLQPATTYYWRIRTEDIDGNVGYSDEQITTTNNIPVTDVNVSPVTLNMDIGDTSTITATVIPSDATDQDVSWSSSDTTVVTVDVSGSVSAIASGSVTVTATTNDGGFTASTNITVLSSAPIVSNITVSDITETSFKVSWNLDEGSKGRIEYGTSSGNYTEQTNSEENFLTYHLQTVGNNNAPPLQPGTTYYWRIRTEDIEGNVGYSDEQVTTTNNTPPQTATFDPIHDAYLQGSTSYNSTLLRVEEGNRITYMKYDLGSVNGAITSVELHFRIGSDEGVGTMEVYKGTTTNWTETTLSSSNKPLEVGLLGSTTEIDVEFADVVVPLMVTSLSGGSDLSLIVKHVGGNDFSMASKEDTTAPGPQLVVTFIPNSGSSLKARADFKSGSAIDRAVLLYPNPTTNTVRVHGVDGEKEIMILDFSGKILLKATSQEPEPVLDLSTYAPGIYYMKVKTPKTSRTFKIVKQ